MVSDFALEGLLLNTDIIYVYVSIYLYKCLLSKFMSYRDNLLGPDIHTRLWLLTLTQDNRFIYVSLYTQDVFMELLVVKVSSFSPSLIYVSGFDMLRRIRIDIFLNFNDKLINI